MKIQIVNGDLHLSRIKSKWYRPEPEIAIKPLERALEENGDFYCGPG